MKSSAFGGAQALEPVHMAESTSKRINQPLYFCSLSLKLAELGVNTLAFLWASANVFLGAWGILLPLGSGKDSEQKVSCGRVKNRPVSRLSTAQAEIFFCLGFAQAAPTMRHGAEKGQFLVCLPPVDGAMCTEGASAWVSADSSYCIVHVQRRRTSRTCVR